MKKISSGMTMYHKKIFPAIWFGFLGLFVIGGMASGAMTRDPSFVLIPLLMAGFGYFFMKKMLWDLADEVFEDGDTLLVKRSGDQERIALSNIMNVSVTNSSPRRITLRLRNPGRFGHELTFAPKQAFTLNPFARNEVAEDLIMRVEQARLRQPA
jgi:hypothetical protein